MFKAGIDPQRKAGSVSKKRYQILTHSIKNILTQAIEAGGTTLQNFSSVEGKPGYFAQTLSVYGCENENCQQCGSKITRIVQNQRSTFYCTYCQT
ncbi:Formamidopyrimidine-DNA glycosylase [uncultured Candidatus Thioglobus sp.]|nr:Formamidopyrimidine-DNA glycosylase [uncultured Candidatus Thioglobus sp.]